MSHVATVVNAASISDFETGKGLPVTLLEVFIVDFAVTYGQTYSLRGNSVWWAAAKQFCDCIGSLVVLDTQEKYDHLMSQIGSLYVSVEFRLRQAKEFHRKYVATNN